MSEGDGGPMLGEEADEGHIHTTTEERLVYMANQMAAFFRSQGHEAAVAGVAEHIRKFWDPRMRGMIVRYVAEGGDGVDAVVREAVRRIG